MQNETESSSKIGELFTQIGDKISEQQWFQELRGKWEELDPQSRTNLKIAGGAGGGLLVAYFLLSLVWGVHAVKKDYNDKQELLSLIQNATEEMRRIKDLHPNLRTDAPDAGNDDWNAYFEQTAGGNGIDKTALTVSPPKTISPPPSSGSSTQETKESLIDISVKHVNIKQIIRFAFALEGGAKPIKLRNLSISTNSDPTGYMDATLSVSAFTLAANK